MLAVGVVVGLAALVAREADVLLAPAAARIDDRYAAAREALRAAPSAGYLTDLDLRTDAGALRYHSAVYALAPTLLRLGAGERLVLADASRSQALAALAQSAGLRVVRTLGPGLALLER